MAKTVERIKKLVICLPSNPITLCAYTDMKAIIVFTTSRIRK